MNPHLISEMCDALLANVVADLVAHGLTAPARQVVTHGPPRRECGQLAVWWQGMQASQGGRTLPVGSFVETVPRRHALHVVTFAIDLALCPPTTPTAKVPTAAAVTASAHLGADYAWTLYRALTRRWLDGTTFGPGHLTAPGSKGVPPVVNQPLVDGGYVVVATSFPYNVQE